MAKQKTERSGREYKERRIVQGRLHINGGKLQMGSKKSHCRMDKRLKETHVHVSESHLQTDSRSTFLGRNGDSSGRRRHSAQEAQQRGGLPDNSNRRRCPWPNGFHLA